MSLQIQCLTVGEFDGMADAWNDLLRHSDADNVFLRWEWIYCWKEELGANHTLLFLAARDAGRLVGLAPLAIDHPKFPAPRCLRFASDEMSPDYMDFILEKGREKAIADAFIEEILRRRGEWDLIKLDNLRVGSPLLQPGMFRHFPTLREEAFHCPYIQIRGDYDAYLKTRSGNSLTYLPKHLKKFFEDPNHTHHQVLDENELDRAMDHVFRLRRTRSESLGIESDFVKPDSVRFHKRLARMFLKAGILNLELTYDRETPVSMGYAFTYKNKVYLFQTAFDPIYKKWSPGGMIIHVMVKRAFERGRDEFDTVKGNEAYKYHWCDHDRVEMTLTVYNCNPLGSAYYAGHYLKLILRWAKHKLLRRQPPTVERQSDGTRQVRP